MFTTILVQPIYNVFIFILGLMPAGDVGLAIIILTLIVRIIFYPVFTSQIRTQMALQAVQPELDVLKEKYKDNPQEMVRRQSELFKKHRISIGSMLGSALLQVIIFIALSSIFYRLKLPTINVSLLYPFVHAPAVVNANFFGILNLITPHHLVLALIVAVAQFFVMYLSLKRTPGNTANMSDAQLAAHHMQRNMMIYMFPIVMGIASYFPAGAVGLYLLVSNVISLGQEWLIRRKPL